MAKTQFSHYRHLDLGDLAAKLNEDYYNEVDNRCRAASELVSIIESGRPHPSTVLYVSLCTRLLDQVMNLVNVRMGILLPYIKDLDIKQIEGHDCANCSNGCAIKHTSQLTGLKESHGKIKEILYRLQMVALPLYSGTKYPDAYKDLRNEMMLIDLALTELFYLEESSLIPKIMEAQKNIHAFG